MRKLDEEAILEAYLNALAHVYDPHSDYMGHEQIQSFDIGMNLSLVGIGATLQSDDGYCKIRELVPGGPAARSGLTENTATASSASRKRKRRIHRPRGHAAAAGGGSHSRRERHDRSPDDHPGGRANAATRKTISLVRDEIKLEDQQAKARIVDLPGEEGGTQRIGVIDLPGFYGSERSSSARVGDGRCRASLEKTETGEGYRTRSRSAA